MADLPEYVPPGEWPREAWAELLDRYFEKAVADVDATHQYVLLRIPVEIFDRLPRLGSAADMPPARIADEAIGLFLEYRDAHGHSEADARVAAVAEVTDGLSDESTQALAEIAGRSDDDDDVGLS